MRRPLGGLERLFWQLSQSGSTNIVLALRLAAKPTHATPAAALAMLCTRYPMLTARTVEAGPSWDLVTGASLQLEELALPAGGVDVWQQSLLAQPLNRVDQPLYRAVWVSSPNDAGHGWLSLVANHTVADGKTLAHLCQEWVQLLFSPPQDQTPGSLAPPAEELAPYRPKSWRSTWSLLAYLCEQGALVLRRRRRGFLAPRPALNLPEGQPRFLRLSLSQEVTAEWLALAKQHRLSLQHLAAAALGHACAAQAGGLVRQLGLLTPVDLNNAALHQLPGKTAPAHPSYLGLYAAGITTLLRLHPQGPLATAQAFALSLRQSLARRRVWGGLRLLGWAGRRPRATLRHTAIRGYWASATLSNIGVLPCTVAQVDAAAFAAAFVGAPRTGLHVLCFTYKGAFTASFCYDDQVYAKADVAAIAERFSATRFTP